MKFSERIGEIQPIDTPIINRLDKNITSTIWNVICEEVLENLDNKAQYEEFNVKERFSEAARFYRLIWKDFLKLPMDELEFEEGEIDLEHAYDELRIWFFNCRWHEVYDFIEYLVQFDPKLSESFNKYLEREFSGYRFLDGKLIEIISNEEIWEVENAIINTSDYGGAKKHLEIALKMISGVKDHDYRNSMKESICALESLCRIILKNKTITLGKALPLIEKQISIPTALSQAFKTIYGFTSDSSGIRHGFKPNDQEVDMSDARMLLITTSAFINYIISKDNHISDN